MPFHMSQSSSEGGRGLLTQARFTQETHAKSLPQEAIVFAPKHLKNLPPCAESVGPWPGNMELEGIPGGVLVPFLTAADKNQPSRSNQPGACAVARQLSGERCTAWSWSECASWGEKKVPEVSPVYISAESILIKLCKIKLHTVPYCFSSSLSSFRLRQ